MSANLWSDFRLGTRDTGDTKADGLDVLPARDEHRSAYQRDFDRLLFSSPVRRLADKTQVFPLEPNDSVRTRLTHSHEVANLARSIGARLHHQGHCFTAGSFALSVTEVLAILQSIGLAHDLGNPPFGHQGEVAIGNWFKNNPEVLGKIPDNLHAEFVKFEGNAQTLRILTRLRQGVGDAGLDLTCATLAALMKYPVRCDQTGDLPSNKKYGFFYSESDVVSSIRLRTGLSDGQRHPLAWIMEAADDIAYSVLDVEDAIKKGILSPDDVYFSLKSDVREESGNVCSLLKEDFRRVREREPKLSVAATREIKVSYLRTRLIDRLIDEAVDFFRDNSYHISDYSLSSGLLDHSALCKKLKKIARQHAFSSVGVTRIEANGAEALSQLMSFFWEAITQREHREKLDSRRCERAAYGWALLSDNYKEVASKSFSAATSDLKTYHECRLLTDMVSGMTDGFAMALRDSLKAEGHIRTGYSRA